MLSNGTPEQMAVWCYPKTDGDEESVIMNVANTLLGRIHLSGQAARITGERRDLIKEGLKVHREIAEFKKRSVPFFPTGLNTFGADTATAGIRSGDKAYLAVWNLTDGGNTVEVPLGKIGKSVKVSEVYPKNFRDVEYSVRDNVLKIAFKGKQARFFGLNI